MRWHSELFLDKNYHINKTKLCLKNGIRLVHIFEDDYDDKFEIIKSIINKFLNLHIEDNNYIIDKFRIYCDFLLSQDFFETQQSYNDNFREGVSRIVYLDQNRPYQNLTFDDILKYDQKLFEFYFKKKLE